MVTAGSRKSPALLGPGAVRGPRSDELPLAIPELPVERELKLDESPTTPSSTSSQLSKTTLTRQCNSKAEQQQCQGLGFDILLQAGGGVQVCPGVQHSDRADY